MKPLDFEQYRLLAEHAPMMVWRAGFDAKCDYFNATWLTFTGRSLQQELGNGWGDGVYPDDRDDCLALYRDRFRCHQAFETEFRLRRHDGVYRHVLDRGIPYEDASRQCRDPPPRHASRRADLAGGNRQRLFQ